MMVPADGKFFFNDIMHGMSSATHVSQAEDVEGEKP
jgi:hypothetical protein